MDDNTPLNAAAVGFGAYAKAYQKLVEDLMEKGIHPVEACQIAKDLSSQFLHFTNNSKFADNMGVTDMVFTAEEDCE